MLFYKQGLEKFNNGDFPEALQFFTKSFSKDPENGEVAYYIAMSHYKLGKLRQSLPYFDLAVTLAPSSAEFYSCRGVALFKTGNAKLALSDFSKAVDLEPANSYRYSCRAYMKDKTGDIEGAVADYEKAIQLDPEDEVAKNNLEFIREKLSYSKSYSRRVKTKDDHTPEEIKAYEAKFNDTPEIPAKSPKSVTRRYFSIIRKTLTSREAFHDFWKFIRNGMRNER